MLIATPNICLDITVRLPSLVPGTVSRAYATDTTAGGKGVNVGRAVRVLGGSATLVGFLPDEDGARFAELLARDGTALLSVAVPGVLRIATILLADDGSVTLVNGRGPQIEPTARRDYLNAVRAAATGQDVLVCSGSLPPGMPDSSYAELTEIGHRAGLPVLVDGAPAVLAQALQFAPDLVSPNLSEAEGLFTGQLVEIVHEEGDDIPERAVAAAGKLRAAGAVRAVVTAGAAGAALATAQGSWWLTAPVVRAANPIGAGDSFAAGAAMALARGEDDLQVVRAGMATASASCETPLAGQVDQARAVALAAQITAQRR